MGSCGAYSTRTCSTLSKDCISIMQIQLGNWQNSRMECLLAYLLNGLRAFLFFLCTFSFSISLSFSSFSLLCYPCLFLLRGMISVHISLLTMVWNVYARICLFVCVCICLLRKHRVLLWERHFLPPWRASCRSWISGKVPLPLTS